jgi:hypothetical protein
MEKEEGKQRVNEEKKEEEWKKTEKGRGRRRRWNREGE